MIEQQFGRSLTVGVEEELWIVDAETLQLVPAVETLVAGAEGRSLPGTLKTELHASVVELTTDVSDTADQALERLVELRRAARDIAERNGHRVAAAGSYPTSIPSEQEIAPVERYRDFVEYAGPSARRQGVSGLHIHIGMPDAETCFRVMETILPWLPFVLAVSANSPYFEGATPGCSIRAEVLGFLPRHGAPPAFRDYAEWERFIERMAATGLANDYTSFWWDVRPHPRFGTLEVRTPDQATSVERTGALVGLVHALCAWAIDSPPRPFEPASAASTSRTAGPPRASGRTASSFIPTATKRSPSRRWRASCRFPCTASTRRRARPTASSRSAGPKDCLLSAQISSSGR